MTTKAYAVRGYVRRTPRDPFAEVREAKTEQLRREVRSIEEEREIQAFFEREMENFFQFNIGGIV